MKRVLSSSPLYPCLQAESATNSSRKPKRQGIPHPLADIPRRPKPTSTSEDGSKKNWFTLVVLRLDLPLEVGVGAHLYPQDFLSVVHKIMFVFVLENASKVIAFLGSTITRTWCIKSKQRNIMFCISWIKCI